jgi:RNA recognition motif-containing protein
MEAKLYVGNLALTTTEQGLLQLFSQAGTVTSVNLITEPNHGPSKGFAFVTMDTPAGARQAIAQFHGHTLGGRKLTVNMARPREAAAPAKPAGYQSRLGAFHNSGNSSGSHNSGSGGAKGGYQSPLGAFGPGHTAPKPSRRRGGGGSQRH